MPRGSKSTYSDKQKREAEHIEKGYEERGTSKHEAEHRAWATVNKETGGGNKSGAGRKSAAVRKSERKTSPKDTAIQKSPSKKKTRTANKSNSP